MNDNQQTTTPRPIDGTSGDAENGGTESTLSAKPTLRHVLLESYAEFKQRLMRRLGSRDLAEDALQETFLRLERAPRAEDVANPKAYVMRVALNFATDRGRSENRLLTGGEIKSLLDVADGAPSPESIATGESELELLQQALSDLPKRRREILLASRVEETPHREIAAKYGVSTKTVEIEVRRALEHCAVRVGRIAIQRFGPQAVKSSGEEQSARRGEIGPAKPGAKGL